MKILIGYLSTYLYLISILLIAMSLNHKYSLASTITRKLIHIFVGFSWFIMIYFFKISWHILIPPLTFLFINLYIYKKNLIPTLESSNHSKGTIYYALSFTILSLITVLKPDFLPFYGLGCLTMTLSDGLAPFFGYLYPKKISHTSKTYLGSFSIFIITLIITLIFNNYFKLQFTLFKVIIISFLAMLLELFEYRGTDNLTLPLGIATISYFLSL